MVANSAAATRPTFPEWVGRYELLLPIGTGGMATVYLARTSGVGGFQRDVALKLVHAHLRNDEECKLQLLEEAKLSARIRHPNVVPVLEVDDDPHGLFLVMDYVEGDTLSGLFKAAHAAGQTLDLRIVARILNDALLGLHAAHELQSPDGKPLNLVHRDFSPQNILVSIQGATRLADFGVAKAADRAVRTKTGLVKGKISYMSPEQARGHSVDRRCDVWAAGVVAWELIAGRRLHQSEDDVATLLSIVTERPPRLAEIDHLANRALPEALDEAIAWALEVDVESRCPTAEDLRIALEKVWNAGAGMATTQELAEVVRTLSGGKLKDRAQKIASVEASRQIAHSDPRLAGVAASGEFRGTPADSAPTTPPPPRRGSSPARPPKSDTFAAGATAANASSDESGDAPFLSPSGDRDATSVERALQLEDSEISAVFSAPPAATAKNQLLWIGLGIAGLVGGAFWFASSETPSGVTTSQAAGTVGAAATEPASQVLGDQSGNEAQPLGTVSDPTSNDTDISVNPANLPAAQPIEEPGPTTDTDAVQPETAPAKPRVKRRPVPPKPVQTPEDEASGRSNKPGLAQSPYSKQKSP